MMACARREPCTSSTAATSMNMTFSACRLEAEYGENSVGSDGKQRVHRADADETRARRGGQAQQLGEIGEIADAPVVLRAQRVELHGHAPEPGAGREFRGLVALVGRRR